MPIQLWNIVAYISTQASGQEVVHQLLFFFGVSRQPRHDCWGSFEKTGHDDEAVQGGGETVRSLEGLGMRPKTS